MITKIHYYSRLKEDPSIIILTGSNEQALKDARNNNERPELIRNIHFAFHTSQEEDFKYLRSLLWRFYYQNKGAIPKPRTYKEAIEATYGNFLNIRKEYLLDPNDIGFDHLDATDYI